MAGGLHRGPRAAQLLTRSLRSYRYDLLLFVAWVGEQDLKSPGDLTTAVLEQYQMHLMLRPSRKSSKDHRTMSAASRNRHMAELRSFFRYLKRSCKLLGNPSAELEKARQTRELPKTILSVPEMSRLLLAIPKDTPSGLRDWAAVELLYGTGCAALSCWGWTWTTCAWARSSFTCWAKATKNGWCPWAWPLARRCSVT